MTTTTAFITLGSQKGTNHLRYGQATVDSGETATLAIPNEGRAVVRIGVPTITTGTLTFTVVPYQGATARTLKDSSGNTVTVASSTGGFVVTIPELSGCYSFTIVCGASQGSARVFDVQMVGLDPVAPSSNEVTIEAGTVAVTQGTSPWIVGGGGTSSSPATAVVTVQRPSVTQVVSTALETSHVLKNSAGQLVELSVFNSKGSAQYILIMNSTTVPSDGAVTLLYPPIPIAANTLITLDFPAPLVASTGIAVSNSSTGSFTKTIGSADCAFYAQVN